MRIMPDKSLSFWTGIIATVREHRLIMMTVRGLQAMSNIRLTMVRGRCSFAHSFKLFSCPSFQLDSLVDFLSVHLDTLGCINA